MALSEICQRKNCDELADHTIGTSHGHPNNRFVLCDDCNEEAELTDTGHIDPFPTRKLYFRCSECDGEASHNIVLRNDECPYCGHDDLDRLPFTSLFTTQ